MINYYERDPDDALGYMRPHLESLRDRGVVVTSMLDIGAAHGHFSHFFQSIFPYADITCVECNTRDDHYLHNQGWDVRFVCLGDTPCKKTFYLNPKDLIGGGSSFYIENTPHFNDPIEEKRDIVTLDSLNVQAEFVKIDVQGAELDVLKGGIETIKKARFLLMELSFVDYNKGSPLIDDILAYTREQGFRMIDTFGPAYGGHWCNNQKVQVDVLLARNDEDVFSML